MDILISNGPMYSTRPLSPNGKEGTTRDSFQWEISEGNEFYISMGNCKLNWRQEFLALWTSSFQICTLQHLCLSMGNYKFRSVKLEVGVSGYMDILTLNTYPARPLSLSTGKLNSTGKKGQPGTHFNGKYQQGMNLISQWELQVYKC